jgi:nucleoporin POM152
MRSGNSHLSIRRVRDGRGCNSKEDATVPPSTVHISVHDPPAIIPLETREDFCVGERLSFRLNGVPPFTIYYKFNDKSMKAIEKTTTFTRLNALPGDFIITEISDSSSKCRFPSSIHKAVHDMPRVKISEKEENIHEGGESVVKFELTGTPPFELTYTRSEYARKNKRGQVLETKTERTYDHVLLVKESEGGEYEPISVRDKWCLTSRAPAAGARKGGQKLLTK